MGERVVEGVVLQREGLVERRDFVDDGEDANEDSVVAKISWVLGGGGRVLENVLVCWAG